MEQDDGGTSSSYIDPVTIHKWYIRRPWIYCTIPLQKSKGSAEYTKLILKKATTGQTRRPTPVKKREKGVRLCPTYLKVCCLEYAR